jgi:hypothetical protein
MLKIVLAYAENTRRNASGMQNCQVPKGAFSTGQNFLNVV